MTEMLSQEEVDALLNAVQKGDVTNEEKVEEAVARKKVEPYDFHKPHLISNEQLRGLQIIHDSFAKGLQSNLSGLLRSQFEVKLVAIDQLLYSEFILSLYNPTFLTVVKAPPLPGNALIEMNLGIIMVVIDRLMGGAGVTVPEPRELTAIELVIVRQVVRATMEELSLAWASTSDNLAFEVESHDFNPEFLRLAPPEASVLSITLDWRIGESAGVINLCYPFSFIKGLLPKLSAETLATRQIRDQSDIERDRMMQNMLGAPLVLHAVLGHSVLPASQVTSLNVGDIICLDNRADASVDLVIEGKRCYRAEVGQRRGKMAIRLLAPVPREYA